MVSPDPTRLQRTGFAVAEDGVRLHWTTIGPATGSQGAFVCCNGVGVSTFFWKYVVAHFSDRFTVLLWDYRGHGQSGRPPSLGTDDLGIPSHTRDLARVMDAAGVDDALMLGHSMGCQVILEFHRNHRARVRGLVPLLGSAGRTLDTFYDNPRSPRYFRLAARLVDRLGDRTHTLARPLLQSRVAWFIARAASLVDPFYASADDMLPYLRHLATMDLQVFIHAVLSTNDHDAWDTLPDIRVPTLIVAAERDAFTPMWLSRKMAASVPGSDFLVLADGTHAAIIEQPETINRRLERFVRDRGVFRS